MPTSSSLPTQAQPVPIAILGPTGYTGLELIEILLRHPGMRIAYLASARTPPPRIDAEFPRLRDRLAHAAGGAADPQCGPMDHDRIAAACKLAFLCLPHEAAMHATPELLKRNVKVVDFSAAYRLKDKTTYEKFYGHAHTDFANADRAIYGLTEFTREAVKHSNLVANPGCYPTAAAVALVPLLRAGLIDPASIIINAASGASGAGREAKPHLTLVEAGDNFSAYGIGVHRHQPEIGQTLRALGGGKSGPPNPPIPDPLFVPHLLPVERGILETIYATPRSDAGPIDTARLMSALRDAYANEPFITVRDDAPTLRDVQHSNSVHVNARLINGRIILIAAEDNLIKGAAGQAVQNANLMLGLDERLGLA